MVPPTVEKRIASEVGAAVMWAAPAQSFKDFGGPPSPPRRELARWNIQLIRAKMFHNLIYNKDPNLGNWLVDPVWNLILIDSSRAFTTGDNMVHQLTRVDRDLWERFLGLDEARVFVRYVRPGPSPVPPAVPGTGPKAVDDITRQGPSDLGGQLLSALNETPVVLAGSELTWIGKSCLIVDLRRSGQRDGRTGEGAWPRLGDRDRTRRTAALTRDSQNPQHYDMVLAMAGKQAEVFGLVSKVDGLSVVQVTLCRESR